MTPLRLKTALDRYKIKVDWTTLDEYSPAWKNRAPRSTSELRRRAAQVRGAASLSIACPLLTNCNHEGSRRASHERRRPRCFYCIDFPPGHYAKTAELINSQKLPASTAASTPPTCAARGASEIQAIDEAIKIGKEAGVPVEIFHLKISGSLVGGHHASGGGKFSGRSRCWIGYSCRLSILVHRRWHCALASSLPPWVAEGGTQKLLERLHDPAIRARIKKELAAEIIRLGNLLFDCGGGAGVMIAGVEIRPEKIRWQDRCGNGQRREQARAGRPV